MWYSKIRGWIQFKGPGALIVLSLIAALTWVYVFKLTSLIDGQNVYEYSITSHVENYEYPWREALDAPYTTVTWVISRFDVSAIMAARLVNALATVASIVMFYELLRNWFLSSGKAVIGALLFGLSSWTLVVGRGAHGVSVGIFLLLLLFTLSSRLLYTTRPFMDWLLLAITGGLALYTPLLLWFIFIAGITYVMQYRRRQHTHPLKHWQKIVVGVVGMLTVTPP